MIDYSKILTFHYAGSEWSLDGDLYDGLVWFSNTTKPTKEELDALWESTQAQEADKKQSAIDAKASAYAKLAALGLTSDEIKSITG